MNLNERLIAIHTRWCIMISKLKSWSAKHTWVLFVCIASNHIFALSFSPNTRISLIRDSSIITESVCLSATASGGLTTSFFFVSVSASLDWRESCTFMKYSVLTAHVILSLKLSFCRPNFEQPNLKAQNDASASEKHRQRIFYHQTYSTSKVLNLLRTRNKW